MDQQKQKLYSAGYVVSVYTGIWPVSEKRSALYNVLNFVVRCNETQTHKLERLTVRVFPPLLYLHLFFSR